MGKRIALAVLASLMGCGGNKASPSPASSQPEPEAEAETAPEEEPASAGAPEVAIPNARLHEGTLVGGQPTVAQLEQARDAGFTTVVVLQREDEEGVAEIRAAAERLGLDYVSIPIGGAEDLNRQNAERLAAALGEAEGEAMVTCGSGNRVGALFALKARYVEGKSPEEAVQIGLDAGMTRLEEAIRSILEAGSSPSE